MPTRAELKEAAAQKKRDKKDAKIAKANNRYDQVAAQLRAFSIVWFVTSMCFSVQQIWLTVVADHHFDTCTVDESTYFIIQFTKEGGCPFTCEELEFDNPFAELLAEAREALRGDDDVAVPTDTNGTAANSTNATGLSRRQLQAPLALDSDPWSLTVALNGSNTTLDASCPYRLVQQLRQSNLTNASAAGGVFSAQTTWDTLDQQWREQIWSNNGRVWYTIYMCLAPLLWLSVKLALMLQKLRLAGKKVEQSFTEKDTCYNRYCNLAGQKAVLFVLDTCQVGHVCVNVVLALNMSFTYIEANDTYFSVQDWYSFYLYTAFMIIVSINIIVLLGCGLSHALAKTSCVLIPVTFLFLTACIAGLGQTVLHAAKFKKQATEVVAFDNITSAEVALQTFHQTVFTDGQISKTLGEWLTFTPSWWFSAGGDEPHDIYAICSSVGFLFNMIATAISIYIFVTEGLQKLTCGYCGNSCALHNVIGTKGKADRRRSTISAKVDARLSAIKKKVSGRMSRADIAAISAASAASSAPDTVHSI